MHKRLRHIMVFCSERVVPFSFHAIVGRVLFMFWELHGSCKTLGTASIQNLLPKMATFPLPVAGSGSTVRGWTGTETAPSGQGTLPDTYDDLGSTKDVLVTTWVEISNTERVVWYQQTSRTSRVTWRLKNPVNHKGHTEAKHNWPHYKRRSDSLSMAPVTVVKELWGKWRSMNRFHSSG